MEQFFRYTWGRLDWIGRTLFVLSGVVVAIPAGAVLYLLSQFPLALLALPAFGLIFGLTLAIVYLLDLVDDFKAFKRYEAYRVPVRTDRV